MNMQVLALAFLATATVGGLAWVFLYPMLSGERKAESRRASISRAEAPTARAAEKTQRSRREQVETSLKDLEARRQQEKSVPLSVRLSQAGLDWAPQKFWIVSAVVAGVLFAVALFIGGGLLGAAGFAFAGGLGLPRWALGFLKKRRENKFLAALPDAVDVIVRGIKAGLPLFESIKVVAADAPEPLRSEFLSIIETQAIGMPLGEACTRLYDRMPLPEANFFGIVISIQQKSGGNLSEALGNLSKVLRDRKKMKEKIQAMSMGSQGLGRHHRLAAADRDVPRLPHNARIHLDALDSSHRPAHAGRLCCLDVDRHHGDEEDDQFRLLMVSYGRVPRCETSRRPPHDDAAGGHCRQRHRLYAGDAAVRRRGPFQAHEGGGERT
ncbi:Flp pilus assembly protein TadB [Bradyrhizobium sp. GM0.4]